MMERKPFVKPEKTGGFCDKSAMKEKRSGKVKIGIDFL